ncbi:MAG: DMT family transporter, partial [Pseudomonadota bacterium]
PFFGPLIRELEPIHLWSLAFQVVIVVTFGFTLWLWLLSIYPAAGVAAFGFLAPIFGVGFGWLVLGEPLGAPILVALALVCAGLILINRPAQVPQNVRGTTSSSVGGRASDASSSLKSNGDNSTRLSR